MKFLEFLNKLNNPEKTRNFNQFLSYSLEPFSQCVSWVFSEHFNQSNYSNHKVSIVGTNGKGSLGYYLQSQFSAMNYRTGFYSSPHLVSPLERIMIDGIAITEEKLDSYIDTFNSDDLNYLKEFSYFEIFTLFSMIAFRDERIEWQIYEAGLGGRLDATKLVEAEFVALTKIGLDHTAILGDSVELILQEKLGIISPKTKCLFALEPDLNTQSNLIEIIKKYCTDKNIDLHFFRDISQEKTYLENYRKMSEWMIQIIHNDYLHTNVPIISQKEVSPTDRPLGRLETIKTEPIVLYDTAHNADAVQNVIKTIERIYPNTCWNVFVACLPDKDLNAIIDCFRSSQNIENFYVLSYPPFQATSSLLSNHLFYKESNEYPRAHTIETEDEFTKLINSCINTKNPILVLGSFRIYSKLKEILY
jgi:dihydrofolate synthase / folylpolyglutamate synthase